MVFHQILIEKMENHGMHIKINAFNKPSIIKSYWLKVMMDKYPRCEVLGHDFFCTYYQGCEFYKVC